MILTLLYSISITLCILFPYQLMVPEGFQFDLRQIPLIIGALYGGYHIAWWLFLVSAIVRYLTGSGGEGLYLALINQFAIFLFVPLAKEYYFKLRYHKRVFAISFIALLSLFFNAIVGWVFFHDPFYEAWDFWGMLMLTNLSLQLLRLFLLNRLLKIITFNKILVKTKN
ncbi:hypothetical protein H1D32_09485 [Anaerobacillus sp. CMMVII]|uniref:LytS/YhcK type 5TM receptor domain-containing protein n=1 Tax=Anaerobacillus sp. CMMVII TaxID=2755588 RepID=UPI0021B83CCE|nr:LytS/YhcK type 5TM receptor domain-containing protein [Anaerobacillus sp. CMMVII]MCT8137967.1 hypothetical protein [Anaerobacillus sp. CMMVII]